MTPATPVFFSHSSSIGVNRRNTDWLRSGGRLSPGTASTATGSACKLATLLHRVLHVQGPGLGWQIPDPISGPREGCPNGFYGTRPPPRSWHRPEAASTLRDPLRSARPPIPSPVAAVRRDSALLGFGPPPVNPVSERLFPGAVAGLRVGTGSSCRGHAPTRPPGRPPNPKSHPAPPPAAPPQRRPPPPPSTE